MLIHQLIHKHLELPGLEQRSVRGAEPSSAGPPGYQIDWSELPMTPLFSTTKHTTSTVPYPPDFNEYNPTQEETPLIKVHLVNGLVGLDYVNYPQDSKNLNSVSCIPPFTYKS